ncbi:MAG: NAD-dependent dihydropyrimidine dehydrogenase subunit PreA [Candidatus Hodarchaeaceae archaeon]|nr:NAD-dependent dihydropyrimidine dehydrogenase subunit PreA [Candidatus Hodarchaeaceae archaeon]
MTGKIDLSVELCGVKFSNPFVLSAGPPTDDVEMVKRAFEAGWAGAILKTTSVESEVVELVYPMIAGLDFEDKKVIGLGNIDLISEHHIDEVEGRVAELKSEFPDYVVGASIMGARKEDWQTLVRRLEAAGVDLIECSFSCPQGSMGEKPGAMVAQDPKLTREVASWVKAAAKRVPIFIKITPQVADIVEIGRAVKESGADGITASNTIPALMGIDINSFEPHPSVDGKSTYSGYSGAAIKPITLRVIAELAKHVGIPISGTGGAMTWQDAVEFMLVGAGNVQFCTAVMRNGYRIIDDLKDGITDYLQDKGMSSVSKLIGLALPKIVMHPELPRDYKVVAQVNRKTCVKDDLCYIACRDGGHQAIELDEERLPVIDEEKCVGCGLCVTVCPVWDCITWKRVEKG